MCKHGLPVSVLDKHSTTELHLCELSEELTAPYECVPGPSEKRLCLSPPPTGWHLQLAQVTISCF